MTSGQMNSEVERVRKEVESQMVAAICSCCPTADEQDCEGCTQPTDTVDRIMAIQGLCVLSEPIDPIDEELLDIVHMGGSEGWRKVIPLGGK